MRYQLKGEIFFLKIYQKIYVNGVFEFYDVLDEEKKLYLYMKEL